MQRLNEIKIFKPDFWKKEWRKASRLSSFFINKLNEEKWISFWNKISDIYNFHNKLQENLILKIISLFEKENVVSKESEVLDIGCGPGTFALPLTRKVKKVVAIDPAEKMLGILMKEAKRKKITNIVPICCKWEEYTSKQRFDFVLASFSPAIRDYDSLTKMSNISRKYACIITYSRTNECKFRNELWQEIMKEPFSSYTYQINFAFNFLYASGFAPNLYFLDFEYKICDSVENFVMQYENYFSIFVKVDENIRNKIYDYFMSRSKGGLVEDYIKKEVAIMWWKVGG